MSSSPTAGHVPKWVAVDFESATVSAGKTPDSFVLTVTGHTSSSSSLGCPVKLSAAKYVTQPEYWRIEVLWDCADAIFQSLCDFSVSIPLDGIRGKQGIEVVGRKRHEQINV